MSKSARRILVTLAVCLFAGLVVWAVFYGKTHNPPPPAPGSAGMSGAQQQAAATAPGAAPSSTAANGAAASQADVAAASGPAASTQLASTQPSVTTAPADTLLQGLRAVASGNDLGSRTAPTQDLGSIDPRRDVIHVKLSRFGAGIERIEFADLWQTAEAKNQAAAYFKALSADTAIDASRLPEHDRYVLVARSPQKVLDPKGGPPMGYSGVPLLAVRQLIINGVAVDILNDDAWSETAQGVFESDIVNASGEKIAHITRRYRLAPSSYDIALEQRVANLTAQPLNVRWQQYGPVDLPSDPSGYIDRRRLHFGYLPDPKARPQLVLADDSTVIERRTAVKQWQRAAAATTSAQAAQQRALWPTDDARTSGWGLSWFGSTNRYFGLTVHTPLAGDHPAAYAIGSVIETVEVGASNVGQPNETVFTTLQSPQTSIAPRAEQAFDVAIFAGPLDRRLLSAGAYNSLSMTGLVIYSMGSCCSFLTFQWLAHLLLWFLSFLHDFVFFDWGLAIIGLVIVVRTLLHPLTKRSQVNMQRFGKKMQALKPELDKLQKKFGSDAKRMQQEQMKLMREHNVNPLQMLGCLPLFLQMPIWIALWATLYLAFDLRQQPAFYGLFQMFGNWPFLADLSSPDSFIPLGAGFTIPLVGWKVTSINLLPILMGVVFFIQQKYLTPPTTATMTPEQIQQQKIMKWMTVVLFPLMMYKSPSGLTLYIMTSSTIGILESRYIRRHIDEIDRAAAAPGGTGGGGGGGGSGEGGGWMGAIDKPKKPKDALGRAWAERLDAIRQARAQAQQERRSFKKRK